VTPFGQFLVGHLIADLFQQVAGLAREGDWKDEIVGAVDGGKPIAVVAVETDSTCAIAASYEAKAFGVKTAREKPGESCD
jgi:hypothetical protein